MKTEIFPTVHLLNSSTVVAISGILRLHIAFLFAGIPPVIELYLAYGLIVYATYTLDRALGCEEDAINRSELSGANRNIGMTACIGAFFVGFIVLARENIFLAPLFPFVTGYVYSKGISVARFSLKLKGGAGRKNAVIGLTWGGSIALIVSHYNHDPFTLVAIFLFFGSKLFINSTLFDFKDVEGDFLAGIKTLPIYLGEKLTKYLLTGITIALHAIMIIAVMAGKIQPEIIIIVTSLVFGLVFISVYSISFDKNAKGFKKHFRVLMVAGESPVALAIRSGFRAFVA